MNIELTDNENKFIAAYFEAVDFTDTGDSEQPEPGTELEAWFVRESTIDCLSFLQGCFFYIAPGNLEQAGHDFWFNRNGHGVGFWSRPEIYGDHYAELLSKRAESYGETNSEYKETHNATI